MTSRTEDPSGKIRIIIAGSFLLSRQALCGLLKREPDIQVVGEAESIHQLRAMAESLQSVDILLIDGKFLLPERIKFLAEIQVKSPGIKILITDGFFSEGYIVEALLHGARGFILKSAQDATYLKAIHVIHKGDIWAERAVLAQVLLDILSRDHPFQPYQESWEDLTPREQEIIMLIARGMTNKEIARESGVSGNTIKTHLSRIFAKLKLCRRIQLALQVASTNKD